MWVSRCRAVLPLLSCASGVSLLPSVVSGIAPQSKCRWRACPTLLAWRVCNHRWGCRGNCDALVYVASPLKRGAEGVSLVLCGGVEEGGCGGLREARAVGEGVARSFGELSSFRLALRLAVRHRLRLLCALSRRRVTHPRRIPAR